MRLLTSFITSALLERCPTVRAIAADPTKIKKCKKSHCKHSTTNDENSRIMAVKALYQHSPRGALISNSSAPYFRIAG